MNMEGGTVFIVNPKSGQRRNPKLRSVLQATGYPLFETAYPGHATEMAQKALDSGCDKIIAVGGDGTVNEVARALVNSKKALGIIPNGSGNGLARYLGISSRVQEAISIVKHGKVRTIDAGLINGKLFLSTAGTGFDAHVACLFASGKNRGFRNYIRITLKEFRNYRECLWDIQLDGHGFYTGPAFMVCAANTAQFGNGATIAPGADCTDGKTDLCLIRKPGGITALPTFFRLFNKTLDRSPYFQTQPFRTGFWKTADGSAVPFHTDGEAHDPQREFRLETLVQSIRILSP